MTRVEKAKQFRRCAAITANAATDAQAAAFPSMFETWRPGITVKPGERLYLPSTDLLYKVRDGAGHTTQADWPPDLTPAMWAVVDAGHEGTADDPIPAEAGMEYEYGLCYLDPNGKVYRCQRTGEVDGGKIVLQYLPSALVGMYFEEVTA